MKNETRAPRVAIRDPWLQEVRGWAGLDPQGRDYANISPVVGIIVGSREQNVDVVPRA